LHDEKSIFPIAADPVVVVPEMMNRVWNQALCLVKNKTHRAYPCSYLGFGQRTISLTETEQTLCGNREVQQKLILGPPKVGLGLTKWTLATRSLTHPPSKCFASQCEPLYLLYLLAQSHSLLRFTFLSEASLLLL
jgi:hypothetical protein